MFLTCDFEREGVRLGVVFGCVLGCMFWSCFLCVFLQDSAAFSSSLDRSALPFEQGLRPFVQGGFKGRQTKPAGTEEQHRIWKAAWLSKLDREEQ